MLLLIILQDNSIEFKGKVDWQLPRQNLVIATDATTRLSLLDITEQINKTWIYKEPPIDKSIHVAVQLQKITKRLLERQTPENSLFQPDSTTDLLLYVTTLRPCELQCSTFDLSAIALHRFEFQAHADPFILCYSEVPDFETAWSTSSRQKVHLADGYIPHGMCSRTLSPFGHRGCRYIHVITLPGKVVEVKAWRREYPLKWNRDYTNEPILQACCANLVACVDGGLVDTCWRERAQWTGDIRMSSLALQALTDNQEVINHVLYQIAQSYDQQTGMVNGCWPIMNPDHKLPMPSFHLAFCLTVIEQHNNDPLVITVLEKTILYWKEHYLRDGLLSGMPGWYFIDWDSKNTDAMGNDRHWKDSARFDVNKPHAVCNAWWVELCRLLGVDSEISIDEFMKMFWTGFGFSMFPHSECSPHATAAVLGSTVFVSESQMCTCLDSLFDIQDRITPYFAYFVAQALDRHKGRTAAIEFIHKFYDPITQFGTIYERTNDKYSMAHGWSVGIAHYLV